MPTTKQSLIKINYMFTFIFKLLSSKKGKIYTFIGTWMQFESKYPAALLLFTPSPLED